jgi:archaellum biogenesis protein FlaJ (TadC family)
MSTRGSPLQILAIVLFIVAIAALAVGVIYLAVPADKLPSVMGRLPHSTRHRNQRGTAAIAAGVVFLIGSVAAFWRARAASR